MGVFVGGKGDEMSFFPSGGRGRRRRKEDFAPLLSSKKVVIYLLVYTYVSTIHPPTPPSIY